MMNKVWLVLRSLFSYFVMITCGIIIAIPVLIIASLPERWRYENRLYFLLMWLYFKACLWSTFLPISIQGKENIPNEPAIIISNHQSSLDIPLVGSLVGVHPYIWLFLARFAKIPVFGYMMRRMNVVVDHSGLRKLVRSLDEALNIIQDRKSHVIIFPEGGRHIDGKIHKFFYGFGILAKGTKRPVVPVLMKNVNKVYPPGSFLLRPHKIDIIIGESFTMREDEDEDAFVQRVHEWYVTTNNRTT